MANNINGNGPKINKINPDASVFSKEQMDSLLKELGLAEKKAAAEKNKKSANVNAPHSKDASATAKTEVSPNASLTDILQANFIAEDDREV